MTKIKTILLATVLATTSALASSNDDFNQSQHTTGHAAHSALIYLTSTSPETVENLRAAYPHASDAWLDRYIRTDILGQEANPAPRAHRNLSPEAARFAAELIILEMAQHMANSGMQLPQGPQAPHAPQEGPVAQATTTHTFADELRHHAAMCANEHAVEVDTMRSPEFKAYIAEMGFTQEDWDALTEQSRLQLANLFLNDQQ